MPLDIQLTAKQILKDNTNSHGQPCYDWVAQAV